MGPARSRNLRIADSFSVRRIFCVPLAVDQQLGARAEGERADDEDRVLAALVLAQLRAHAGEQHAEPERLADIVVGARFEAENGVGVARRGGQHDHRRADVRLAQAPADIAPVAIGQADIEQDQVEMAGPGGLQRRRAVADGYGVELAVDLELLREGLAQHFVVVDQQDLLALPRHTDSTPSKPVPGRPAGGSGPPDGRTGLSSPGAAEWGGNPRRL